MKTYDYYCTWQAQNIYCQVKGVSNRDYLDEEAIFGENGIVYAHPELRKELYFVLDDGWDVPYSHHVNEDYPFASHEIKSDRFPSFVGTPKEKLKQMVEKITSFGWKGVGIWVCAQGSGEDYHKSIDELKDFFKERLLWSKYAHISYWKVDWGIYCNEVEYRKMLVELTNEYYPELIIENAMCINPVNGFNDGEEENLKYLFPWTKNMKKYIDKVTSFSEVFRSYDVTEELSTTTTLARLVYLLKQQHCIINCEDELYLGAVLGCSLGIERNKNCVVKGITPTTSFHNRDGETLAAIRYRKISPCFAGGKLNVSKEKFLDECYFDSYWSKNIEHQNVKQICPARVARNTSLPKVTKIKEAPYVVCCKDHHHHYAIGTFKRLNHEEDERYSIHVTVNIDEMVNHIAIFSNHIKVLKIQFNEELENKKVYLVDLIHNHQKDITNHVIIKNNMLKLNYEELTKDFTCEDLSSKAYMLKLK